MAGEEKKTNIWTWTGLAVALAGPALVGFLIHSGYAGEGADRRIFNWFGLWACTLLVLAVLVLFERQPLSAIGFRGFTRASALWGAVLGVAAIMVYPVAAAILKAFQLPQITSSMSEVLTWPLWLRLGTLVTAGFTEEILFRGYAISRLKAASGSTLIAVLIPSAVFVALHLPSWGAAHLIYVSLAAALFTGFFLWRRDIWTNIIGHIVTDFVPLIVLPLTGMPPN